MIIHYFCNVSDEGLQAFIDHSMVCIFRGRIGEEGIAIIEKEIFEVQSSLKLLTKK